METLETKSPSEEGEAVEQEIAEIQSGLLDRTRPHVASIRTADTQRRTAQRNDLCSHIGLRGRGRPQGSQVPVAGDQCAFGKSRPLR